MHIILQVCLLDCTIYIYFLCSAQFLKANLENANNNKIALIKVHIICWYTSNHLSKWIRYNLPYLQLGTLGK